MNGKEPAILNRSGGAAPTQPAAGETEAVLAWALWVRLHPHRPACLPEAASTFTPPGEQGTHTTLLLCPHTQPAGETCSLTPSTSLEAIESGPLFSTRTLNLCYHRLKSKHFLTDPSQPIYPAPCSFPHPYPRDPCTRPHHSPAFPMRLRHAVECLLAGLGDRPFGVWCVSSPAPQRGSTVKTAAPRLCVFSAESKHLDAQCQLNALPALRLVC